MNNTTPIKILTAAVLLTFGFALTANAALINKGVTEMNHEYTVSDTLSARQQVIPLIAASMASSQMDKLNAALNQGLDAGLTINEAKEILIQLYAYTGFPRSLNALNELMKVVETRKQRGIEDIEGKAPIARIPVGDELRRVGTANQTKISGAPVQGPLFDFAPTINQFLQTHLFGDIFARDNLDWQSRELATVGALAATPGVEAQLLSHTRASLRVGLTAAQLRQLAQVLREHGDNDAATRADEALQKALENSTPDGREGFQNIFLRRGFSTYIVDQPRRGDAGRTTVEGTVTPKPDEQMWFNQFRVGVWPDYFKGVQFSHDKEALNQYFRQMTPNTGPFDVNVISDAMSAVVDKSGPAILFTHSQGGGPGWYTAMKNNKVKAIVAFEPGSGFVFPEKELPAPMPSAFDTLKGEPVPMEQFMALTKIPILIIYGDNIPDKPVAMPAQDSWRVRLAMARKWRDVVNKHGGDVTVTHLPEVGIKGNTHFPFTDLNNVQIADLVSRFLKEKNLQ